MLKEEELEIFKATIHIKEDTLNLIKSKGEKKAVSKGEIVFNERDEVNTIYFVLSGKVTMYRLSEDGQKRVIYILGPGKFINEVIFDGLPASIGCEAFEDCQLAYFYKEDLLQIMSTDFELTKFIISSMGKKIRRLYRQLKNTVPIKIDKKLAAKLWKLSKDYGIEIEEGTLIDLDISITYLASMLGSARETISKSMTRLEKEGLITYKGKRIVVPKREALSVYFRGI
ncbi:Crp/Fnr family transcriptional regulator [Clostridium cellulovorans]|uniref:Transcriptional regulator, Crp/Fnr family n=1 Tax=Clostridium cellulovorans (strain ATCC 35296 / DSM 3052 / OCM 3 / 743B) TaxID=573061 RepID=D9STE8_CLOC7|nr:Crp/Fnr family transcriptional regulator [Clostridium cellulovorans]ADL50764.1 transcriptional regulator, Crp/Fnr family [Clostridium cellulovorans 743B]